MNEAGLATLRQLSPGSREWREMLQSFPVAQAAPKDHLAYIEGTLISPEGGGVVFGWALHAPDALVWIEDEQGNARFMSHAFRRERHAIRDGFPHNPWSDQAPAFVIHLPGLSEHSVIATLAKKADGEMLSGDPRRAADKLFLIETEDRVFHRRAGLVDWPVLGPLIRRRLADGTMLVLQAGVPAVCIVHASCTLELCQTMIVPHVLAKDIAGGVTRDQLPDLLAQFDAEAFDANRRMLAGRYGAFLESNGLSPVSWLKRIAESGKASEPVALA